MFFGAALVMGANAGFIAFDRGDGASIRGAFSRARTCFASSSAFSFSWASHFFSSRSFASSSSCFFKRFIVRVASCSSLRTASIASCFFAALRACNLRSISTSVIPAGRLEGAALPLFSEEDGLGFCKIC